MEHSVPPGCGGVGRGRNSGTEGQWDRGSCGHTHREGGLGHLAAVVCNAPTEAAWDAAAVVLLLAAHHRLHGVAAHPDGSLWQRGQGTAGQHHPAGCCPQNSSPASGLPQAHGRATCLCLPQEQAHPNNSTTGDISPGRCSWTWAALGEPHSHHRIRFSPHCSVISRTAATGPGDTDTSAKPCLLPGQPHRPLGRTGDHSQAISHVCVHTFHNSPWTQGGQILWSLLPFLHLSCTSPASLQPASKWPLSWRLHSHIKVLLFFSKLLLENTFSLNCCFWFGQSTSGTDWR